MAITDPDLWPTEVKRRWTMTYTFQGLDRSTVIRETRVDELERVNENFMLGLLEQCIEHYGGWVINPMMIRRHFKFDEMPPTGAKVIAIAKAEAA